MYTLYYSPGSASTVVQGVLEELGVPYKAELVDMSAGAHQSAAYLKLNPTGKIPALGLENGDVISESAALCLFLADRHPQGGMAPSVDDPKRGTFLQWLMYLTNTLQPADLRFYYSERYTSAAGDLAGIKEAAQTEVATCWARIDTHLAAHGPYLLGDRYSVADIFCYMLSSWQECCPTLNDRFPHVKKLADLVIARPAIQRMLKANG
jgi:glutathione S-transferase